MPAVQVGNLLHVSGQLPFDDGRVMIAGSARTAIWPTAMPRRAACGIMLLAQINKALGDLHRVERIVKLGVFVNSAGSFTDQPKVANGASELMEQVFGEIGRHARSAVGVPTLPLGAAVEVDAIVAIRAG